MLLGRNVGRAAGRARGGQEDLVGLDVLVSPNHEATRGTEEDRTITFRDLTPLCLSIWFLREEGELTYCNSEEISISSRHNKTFGFQPPPHRLPSRRANTIAVRRPEELIFVCSCQKEKIPQGYCKHLGQLLSQPQPSVYYVLPFEGQPF